MKEHNDTIKNKELHDDERISSYIRGEMTESEESEFMNDLHSDDDLRSKAVDMAYLTKALKDVGKENDTNVKEALLTVDKDNLESIAAKATGTHKKVEEKSDYGQQMEVCYCEETLEDARQWEEYRKPKAKERKSKVLRRRIITVLSSAACIVVLCIVGIQYRDYRTTTGLGEQYATTFVAQQMPSIRGVQSHTSNELVKLYANVQKGTDLDATIKRLTVLWEVSTLDTYNDYTDDAPIIGWNLAIAHLKDNDKDAAKSTLEKLISKTEDGNVVNDKAKELLGKLK